MAQNTRELWSNDIKIASLHKKLQKIALQLQLRPQIPQLHQVRSISFPIYKVSLSKISDNVIAFGWWFGPPPIKQ